MTTDFESSFGVFVENLRCGYFSGFRSTTKTEGFSRRGYQ